MTNQKIDERLVYFFFNGNIFPEYKNKFIKICAKTIIETKIIYYKYFGKSFNLMQTFPPNDNELKNFKELKFDDIKDLKEFKLKSYKCGDFFTIQAANKDYAKLICDTILNYSICLSNIHEIENTFCSEKYPCK
jgi:hypothetical protein